MKRILIVILVFTMISHAYIRVPFKHMDVQTFELSLNHYAYSFDASSTQPYLGVLDGVFRFNDVFFGVLPRTTNTVAEPINETQFSFGWFLLEDVDVGPFQWSTQLGAYSIGMTDTYRDSVFSNFIVDYAASHYVDIKKSPLFFAITNYFSSNKMVQHGGVLGIEFNQQRLFLEYDGASKQLFLGVDYDVLPNVSSEMAINISSDQNLDDETNFYPTFKIGLKVTDIFSTSRKEAPPKPLPIDDDTFALLERGLLAFNAEKYTTAANNYRQVLEKYPNFILAYVRLGNCYYQMKQWEMAKKAWSSALKLDPTNDEVFMALIQLQNRQYQVDELIDSAEL